MRSSVQVKVVLLGAALSSALLGCSAPVDDEPGEGADAVRASSFDQPKTLRAAAQGVVVVDRASLWYVAGGLAGSAKRIHRAPQVRDRAGLVESHREPRVIGERVYWYTPEEHVASVRLDGTGEVDLGPGTVGALAWSGKTVAFASGKDVRLSVDGAAPRVIFSSPDACTVEGVTMDPSSAAAAFVATRCTTTSGSPATVIRTVEGLEQRLPKATDLSPLGPSHTFAALAGADEVNVYVLAREGDEAASTTALVRVPRSGAAASRVAVLDEQRPIGLRQEGTKIFFWSREPGRATGENLACSVALANGREECVGHAAFEADPAKNEVVQDLNFELYFEPDAARPVAHVLRRKGPAMPTFHRVEVGLSR